MPADLITFDAYGELDLDEDPCIFTPCGHIFTIATLDGTMDMQEHYELDQEPFKYTG